MHIDLSFIQKTLTKAHIFGNLKEVPTFCVDSRNIVRGDIFVAIAGARVDGHDFIADALNRGAQAIMIASCHADHIISQYSDTCIIVVPDPYQALIQLAVAWRAQFSYPIIGVTGSVGKTSTKEMLKSMLSFCGKKVIASVGNQNTMIGAAINILKMTDEYDVAVFELGISQVGNMKNLAALVQPTIGIITYIGHAHMQGLGGLVDIAREKRDIFSLFKKSNVGIINGDQSVLNNPQMHGLPEYNHTIITFGLNSDNQIHAVDVLVKQNSIACNIVYRDVYYPVTLSGCNLVKVHHALACLAVAVVLNIDFNQAISGVQKNCSVAGRFVINQSKSGNVVIDDAYNANPDSMKASLLAFAAYQTDLKKILVLGDMLELGDYASLFHKQLAEIILDLYQDVQVVLVGKHVQETEKMLQSKMSVVYCDTTTQVIEFIKQASAAEKKAILCKASFSVGLSKIIPILMEC